MQVVDIFYETLQKSYRNGIKIIISEDYIIKDGLDFGGYFDAKEREIAIATVHDPKVWVPIFVHESCHLDQWLEQVDVWTENIEGLDNFIEWLQNKIEVKDKDELSRMCRSVQLIEVDCEKRTVDKFREWGMKLPNNYIKKANAYILSYQWCRINKKWMGNYEDKRILGLIPNMWLDSYENISEELYKAMDLVYSEEE